MSAWTDLQRLPELFRLADIVRELDVTPALAKLMAHRWKHRELIVPMGPRVGLYANKARQPDWESLRPQAVAMALPSAVLVGPTVLHHHGWTTQIPRALHVVVPRQRTLPTLDGVVITCRPPSWYERYQPAVHGERIYGLPALSPPQAWHDLLSQPDPILDESDLDDMGREEWMEQHENEPTLFAGTQPVASRSRLRM